MQEKNKLPYERSKEIPAGRKTDRQTLESMKVGERERE